MNLRARDRIALGAVALVVLVGGFYLLALKPERNQAASLQAAIATQQQTLTEAEQNFAAGRAAQASLKADAAQWSALNLAVPTQSDIPALLRTLQRTAQAAGVAMQSITLSGGSSPSAASPTPSSTTSAGGPTGVPIQLTFAGGYAALNRLVARLDGLVVVSGDKVRATGPLLSISNVSLSGAANLTVQLSATIYQLDAPSAASTTTGGQS